MKSIYKTVNGLLKQYDFNIDDIQIVSKNVDVVFKVIAKGDSYCFKLYNSAYDRLVFGHRLKSVVSLVAEMEYLEKLHKYLENEKIIIQKPIKTQNDLYLAEVNGKLATLTTWIDGDLASEVDLIESDYIEIGRVIGLMHKFCKYSGFKLQTERDYFDKQRLVAFFKNIALGNKSLIYSDKVFRRASEWRDELEILLQDESRDEFGIIHGDFYSYNLVKTVNNQLSPIDFGLCTYGFYCQDLASICNEMRDDTYEKAFLKSYEETVENYVSQERVLALKKYLTLMYLAANYKNADNYEWILC